MKNNDVQLYSNERIDDLQYNGLVIVQNKDYYCFSSDAVLLANFVKAKNTDTIVDLCSGSGVVGILAQAKTNAKKVVLIEKQKELADMCKKTISINDLNEKVELHNIDVIDAPSFFGNEKFDVVCCNPPYYLPSQKKMSGNSVVDIAKFEMELSFEKLCEVVNKLLKFGGKFFLINDSTRIAEILTTLKKYNLEPKVVEFVYPKAQVSSNVVLIEAVKFGKNGTKVNCKIIDNN